MSFAEIISPPPEPIEDYSGLFDEVISEVNATSPFYKSDFQLLLEDAIGETGVEQYRKDYREQILGVGEWSGAGLFNPHNRFIRFATTLVQAPTANMYFELIWRYYPELSVEGLTREDKLGQFMKKLIAIDDYIASKYLGDVAVYSATNYFLSNQTLEFVNSDNPKVHWPLPMMPLDMVGLMFWVAFETNHRTVSKQTLIENLRLATLHNNLVLIASNHYPRDAKQYFDDECKKIETELDLSESEIARFREDAASIKFIIGKHH